jgi:cytochrome P450
VPGDRGATAPASPAASRHLGRGRARPPVLTAAERLTTEELRDSLVLLIFGGFDTTRNQLGLAMQAFIESPGQWRLLAERADLGPAAVEEVMRVSPTTTWVTREAVRGFIFDGLDISAGTTIHLYCASAGTDPLAVPDEDMDITATGRPPHFAFRRRHSLLPRPPGGAGRHERGPARARPPAARAPCVRRGDLAAAQR